MILLFDVGNTNITFTVTDGKTIDFSYRLNTETSKTEDEYFLAINSFVRHHHPITDIAIASVVPRVTETLKSISQKFFNIEPLIVGPGIKTGVLVKTDNPKEVGADLICAAAAVLKCDKPKLVVDLGTATKYIYIQNKRILGVVITPGVKISIKALVGNTALLPDIDIEVPKRVLGTNSVSCMQSGVTYGVAAQVDGLIDRIKEETGQVFDVILTGGLSKIIAPLCKHKLTLEPDLILEGLLSIFYRNMKG